MTKLHLIEKIIVKQCFYDDFSKQNIRKNILDFSKSSDLLKHYNFGRYSTNWQNLDRVCAFFEKCLK